MLESNPPDRKVHSGTSETSCLVIESFKRNSRWLQVWSKFSVCGSLFNFQYLSICNPERLKTAKWAGFNSKILLKIVVPGVCAGPIPKSSEIPWESRIFWTPGY